MDIDTILEKWDDAKKRKVSIEKECDMYKDAVERYLNKKDKNTLSGKYYSVSRRSNTRQQLSKQSVPLEIWEKYATRVTYMSYYLKENK